MPGMDMSHAHALFPRSTDPYSARRSGKARATPSVGKIFAPCMIPGTSTHKRGLHGKIRAPCILFSPIARKKGSPWQRLREMHAFRAVAGRIFVLCIRFGMQSGDFGYIARESCHSSQSNLEDRHNKSIGRQNANQKRSWNNSQIAQHQGDTHKTIVLAARSNAQINLSPRRFPQGHQSSQHETISKAAQHQGSLEKSCLRKLIRRSSMST